MGPVEETTIKGFRNALRDSSRAKYTSETQDVRESLKLAVSIEMLAAFYEIREALAGIEKSLDTANGMKRNPDAYPSDDD